MNNMNNNIELITPGYIVNNLINKHNTEFELNSDVDIILPCKYDDIDKINKHGKNDNEIGNIYIKNLDERFSANAIANYGYSDFNQIKSRLRRVFLEELTIGVVSDNINIYEEYNAKYLDFEFCISTYLIASYDNESNAVAVHLTTYFPKFLISHYVDSAVSDRLLVKIENKWLPLLNYLKNTYGVTKVGTTKIISTIWGNKKLLETNQIASLLLAENIYLSDEEYGKINDKDILNIVKDEIGMGQFDRATVYAYKNSVIQFIDKIFNKKERIIEEVIVAFDIEMIVFEEISIRIAQDKIKVLLKEIDRTKHFHFLSEIRNMYINYVKTIDFWNLHYAYPAAQKSYDTIKNSIGVEELKREMQSDFTILNNLFNANNEYESYLSSVLLSFAARIITAVQIVSIFTEFSDGESFNISKIITLFSLIIIFIAIPKLIKKIME